MVRTDQREVSATSILPSWPPPRMPRVPERGRTCVCMPSALAAGPGGVKAGGLLGAPFDFRCLTGTAAFKAALSRFEPDEKNVMRRLTD